MDCSQLASNIPAIAFSAFLLIAGFFVIACAVRDFSTARKERRAIDKEIERIIG